MVVGQLQCWLQLVCNLSLVTGAIGYNTATCANVQLAKETIHIHVCMLDSLIQRLRVYICT